MLTMRMRSTSATPGMAASGSRSVSAMGVFFTPLKAAPLVTKMSAGTV